MHGNINENVLEQKESVLFVGLCYSGHVRYLDGILCAYLKPANVLICIRHSSTFLCVYISKECFCYFCIKLVLWKICFLALTLPT